MTKVYTCPRCGELTEYASDQLPTCPCRVPVGPEPCNCDQALYYRAALERILGIVQGGRSSVCAIAESAAIRALKEYPKP